MSDEQDSHGDKQRDMPMDPSHELEPTLDQMASAEHSSAEAALDETIDHSLSDTSPVVAAKVGGGLNSKNFGDYELIAEVARGGMGVVFKARQVSLNRIVALKMILSGELAGEEEVKRFQAEAEAAAQLDHPGIVPIYETGEHVGLHYFSMGYVDGESLQYKLREGPLPAREAADLCRKMAEAVAYAHDKGVIHRDLKPGNVLLGNNGEPRVTDFGLAKQVESDSDLTRSGAVMGTPSYMPPEQALGKTTEVGPRADVYSLGAILYCMLTGRPPFQATTQLDTLRQVIEQEPVRPREFSADTPKDLETICLKCLEKEVGRRYQTALSLRDDIERFVNGESILARPIGRLEKSIRWSRRNPTVAGLILAVGVVLLLGIIVSTHFAIAANNRAAAEKLEKDRVSQKQYASLLSLTQAQWENGQVSAAIETLAKTEKDYRGWEFNYLKSLFGSTVFEFSYDWTLLFEDSTGITTSTSQPVICISPNRDIVAVGGRSFEDESDTEFHPVVVWTVGSRQQRRVFQAPAELSALAISPDGTLIACGTEAGDVCVWNLRDRRQVWKRRDAESRSTKSLFFSLEGNNLICHSRGEIVILETSQWTEVRQLPKDYTLVALSPSGKSLAGGLGPKLSADRQHFVCGIEIIDVETGDLSQRLAGHTDMLTSLHFSPDGSKLYSAGGGTGMSMSARIGGQQVRLGEKFLTPDLSSREVGVWDLQAGTLIGRVSDGAPVSLIALSPNGRTLGLVRKDENSVRLIDLATGATVGLVRDAEPVSFVQFLDDLQILVNKRLYSTQDAKLASTKANMRQLAISADQEQLVGVTADAMKSSLLIWRLRQDWPFMSDPAILAIEARVEASDDSFVGSDSNSGAVTASAESMVLAAGSAAHFSANDQGSRLFSRGVVQLRELTSGELLRQFKGPSGGVKSVSLDARDEKIAMHWGQRPLQDMSTLSVFSIGGEQILNREKKNLKAVSLSPSGRWVLCYSDEGIELISTTNARDGWSRSLAGTKHTPRVDLLWLPSEREFLLCADNWIQLIALDDARVEWEYRLPSTEFHSFALAQSGTRLFCGTGDGAINIINVASGEPTLELRGHDGSVNALAIDDSGLLYSTGPDQTIRRWDGTDSGTRDHYFPSH